MVPCNFYVRVPDRDGEYRPKPMKAVALRLMQDGDTWKTMVLVLKGSRMEWFGMDDLLVVE